MPLLDHFHPPFHPRHHRDAFHSNWATRIADRLNDHWLPQEFLAQETTHSGGQLEIDIATYEAPFSDVGDEGGVSVATKRVYAPPPTLTSIESFVPDVYEVRVFTDAGGAALVAAIELVSPANKDREVSRDAFVTKCVSLLHQGVSVVVVDIVTSRRANLHREIMRSLGSETPDSGNQDHLYTSAYRPAQKEGRTRIDVWMETCQVGFELPDMPLRLTGDMFVPVELETTYQEACRRRRLI